MFEKNPVAPRLCAFQVTQYYNSITTAYNIVSEKCLLKIEIGLNFFYRVCQPFFAAIMSGLFFHFEAKCKFRL